MFTTMQTLEKPPRVTREQNTFLKRMRPHINSEIFLKIHEDDAPISYVLKDIGQDYIVVAFAQMERSIPLSKIIYVQIEAK